MTALTHAFGVFWQPSATFEAEPRRRTTIALLVGVISLSVAAPIAMALTERGRDVAVQRRVEVHQKLGQPISDAQHAQIRNGVLTDSLYSAGFLGVSRLLGVLLVAGFIAVLATAAGEKRLGFASALFIAASAGLVTVAGDLAGHTASYLARAAVSPGSGAGIATAIGASPTLETILASFDAFSIWWLAVILIGIRRRSEGRTVAILVAASYAVALSVIIAAQLLAQP